MMPDLPSQDDDLRRIVRACVLALLIVVALTACRPGVNEEATTESDDVAAASTVIRFADEAFKEAIYRPLMTAFAAENPGFRIEYIPLEDARDSNTGEIDLFRLASLADVMVMPRAPAGGESSYFVDLSTRLDEQGLSAADFWPGALAACQGQDAVAALPLRVTPATVYLNRSLLNGAQPAVGWGEAGGQPGSGLRLCRERRAGRAVGSADCRFPPRSGWRAGYGRPVPGRRLVC
jgi:ABC-type glycerol-3-phosphate transport system substrate-binding protein